MYSNTAPVGLEPCPNANFPHNDGAYLAYRFLDMNGDGLTDLVTALHYDYRCYDPFADPEAVNRWNLGSCEPETFGNGRWPLESCGAYPWEIYWNEGGGHFNTEQPTLVQQPVPLESDTGDSSLGNRSGATGSARHLVIDIDGDGFLDGVTIDNENDNYWIVFRGDGSGQFHARPNGTPYLWSRPFVAPLSFSGLSIQTLGVPDTLPGIDAWGHVNGYTAFQDMNGDGLVDYLWTDNLSVPSQTHIYLNRGNGFRTDSTDFLGNRRIHYGTGSARYSRTDGVVSSFGSSGLSYGWRRGRRFALDYDQDGRLDSYIADEPPGSGATLLLGDGSGRRTGGEPLNTPETAAIPQLLEAWSDFEGTWHVTSDFIDLDGDGASELVDATAADSDGDGVLDNWRMYQDQRDGRPMRLLNQIDNGAGGRIEIRYRASTDPEIDIPGTDDRRGMPTHTWLVESVTTTGLVDQVGTTTYRYGSPIWNRDDRGRYGFRGFDRVRENRPAGSVVDRRYDYTLDWSGREIETVIYDDTLVPGAPLRIDTIRTTTWQPFTLFGSDAVSYQVTVQKTYTCSNGQTFEQCQSSGALKFEATTWEPQTSRDENGPALLFVPANVWEKRGDAITSGDRRIRKRYLLFASADDYRLRPLSEVVQEREGQSDVTRSHTEYDYDMEGNRWRRVSRHNSDGTQATEYSWLELPTGQVTGRIKPQQFADRADVRSHVTYDAYQVHVAATENELHHVVYTEYDLGTGALLSTRGPNSRPCGPSCGDWEETRTEIDGFGRPLRVYVNVENPATGRYESGLIQRFTYFDGEQPQRLREERLIYDDDTRWVTSDTIFDGFGRVSTRKQFRFEAGKPDGVVEFHYGAEGRLQSVSLPDPSQDTDARVTYQYYYNSLGDLLRLIRPDQSEIAWSHDGLRTVRTEVAATGPLAEATTVRDVFDRLVQVDERLEDGTLATTTYAHDVLGNVRRVTNSDGIVTELAHDWLGRRTRITRGDRVWRYEYDLNGNLLREIAPVPSGASDLAYTCSTVYDDLDRPTSRLAGVRALSPDEQRAINHGLVLYAYDQGENGKGRLSQVTSRDSVWTRAFTYDTRGHIAADTVSFDLEPALGVPIADTRTQHRTYGPLGQLVQVYFGDGLDQGTSTRALFLANTRGQPAGVVLMDGGAPFVYVAALHNAAGLMTSVNGQVTQSWTYDRLGRVASMEARSNAAVPQVQVSESFTYFGMDDPSTLTSFREGLGTHHFEFAFDRQHQLSAASSDRGYEARFTYARGGRLQTAYVDAPKQAPLALPRDAIYEYDGPDPEAVSRLADSATEETLIAYGYDLSGNVTSRDHGSGKPYKFLYDGEDWQRRATSPDGTSDFYYYDHDNRRFLTVTLRPGGTVDKARLVHGSLEVEYSGTGEAVETTAHLSLDRPVAKVVNRGSAQRVIHGQFGNLLGAFNPAGTSLAVSFMYGPFGEILAESGDTPNFIYRYNGKEQDDLTQLSYYGQRYFDPYSLTWTQADPLYRFAPDLAWDQPRRTNLYAFSLNNPVRYFDPDGRNPGRPPGPFAGPGFTPPPALTKIEKVGEETARAIEVTGDVASFVPGIDTAGDVTSLVGSLLQGDTTGVGISLAAAFIPGLASGVLKEALKASDEVAEGVKAAESAAQQGKRTFSKADRAAGLEKAKDAQGVPRCAYCKRELDPKAGKPNSYEADHRMPHSKGGPSTPDNLAPACRTCNRSKGAKTPEAWSSPEEWNPWIL